MAGDLRRYAAANARVRTLLSTLLGRNGLEMLCGYPSAEAIVECPAVADGAGIRPIAQKPLPAAMAGVIATRIQWAQTTVEAALEGLGDLRYEGVGDFARLDHHRALRRGFPDARITLLARPPAYLWARRSLFVMRGSCLLVTEVFLPSILGLTL